MAQRSPIPTVFMFSGQGSQYVQMGKDLFEHNEVFRQSMLDLDGVACRLSGTSVLAVLYCAGSRAQAFDRTLLTHPAIFMVEYSVAQCLMRAGIVPDMTLGVSLGSFAAATVAGFMDVEDAMAAVMKQAIALETCCEPGGMLAVLAPPALFAEEFVSGHSELAAVNFETHFAIASRQESLAGIETGLSRRGVTHQRLPVSFAFHSRWIEAAQKPFLAFARSLGSRQGRLPLVCCEQAATLYELPPDFFWRVVREPMRFQETIAQLERNGAHRYIDAGPGGTLATFLKYGLPADSASTVNPILTPYGRDQKNLSAVLTAVRSGGR
jgi:bacillaene synthase trans-acting acyltransferase